MRIERLANGRFDYHFDSAVDLQACLDTMTPRHDAAEGERLKLAGNVLSDRDRAWYGGISTVDDARKLARDGWAEGAEKISAIASKLTVSVPQAQSVRRRMVWDSEGDELEMVKVYSGELDTAWRNPRRMVANGPQILTLYIPFGDNCQVDAETMFWKCAPGLVVADTLENAGYRVELVAVGHTQHNGSSSVSRIVVKESSHPIDLGSLAAICCHAGIFRTLGFAAILHHVKRLAGSLGCVRPIDGLFTEPGSYTLSSGVTDERTAIAECERILGAIQNDGGK